MKKESRIVFLDEQDHEEAAFLLARSFAGTPTSEGELTWEWVFGSKNKSI